MRPSLLLLIALALGLALPAAANAQWQPNGAPVCTSLGSREQPLITADGAGGAFIAWVDYGSGTADVYVQRLTAGGEIAPGWPAGGAAATTAAGDQFIYSLVADRTGGVYLTWDDLRDARTNDYDVYAQHVLSNGTVDPNWPVNGLAMAALAGAQRSPRVASDGQGGAFFVWQDERNGGHSNQDIYLQHVTAAGTLAPGWPAGGKGVCTAPKVQLDPAILADGQGGVFLAWGDTRNSATSSTDVYALRITTDGDATPGWLVDGNVVCNADGIQGGDKDLAPDGTGGIYVGWLDFRTTPPSSASNASKGDIYLQRVTGMGAIAVGWPANGFPVCVAPDIQQDMRLTADASGGVLLAWSDYRSFFSADLYAQRVTAAAALAPGWPVDGRLASTAAGYQVSTRVAADGQGGAYLACSSLTNFYQVSAQHLSPTSGLAPGWPPEGVRLALTPGEQQNPNIVADGYGSAIVVWDDDRGPGTNIFAQKLGVDGPTPVQVALVSAAAAPDCATLTWFMATGAGLAVNVYRRSASTEWLRLGSASADGTGKITYEDRTVVAGQRYAYRLGYSGGVGEAFSAEVWLDIPSGFQLSLDGLRPNPALGDLVASFSLPNAEPAKLELLDVTGRSWLAREVGSLGAGRHVLRLSEGARVPAGIYWLRLTQGGRSLLARGVVVR